MSNAPLASPLPRPREGSEALSSAPLDLEHAPPPAGAETSAADMPSGEAPPGDGAARIDLVPVVVLLWLVVGLVVIAARTASHRSGVAAKDQRRSQDKGTAATSPRPAGKNQKDARPPPRPAKSPVAGIAPPPRTLRGRAFVIDGDTIVIGGKNIRLFGIDAPELDHPWGISAKWALVKLCKGQTVTAEMTGALSHERLVARCFLQDGRDLSAEMVRAGFAIDWPKFSGGIYRHLEHGGVRRKFWRAAARQRGMMPR